MLDYSIAYIYSQLYVIGLQFLGDDLCGGWVDSKYIKVLMDPSLASSPWAQGVT